MRFMVIACEVLTREVCHCVARTPHIVDLEFTAKGSHDDPEYLRSTLQKKIDSCEQSDNEYDAILLCYGLCGNSVIGLQARSIPLVIPRAHDCCTLFLGSKDKFKESFADRPSTPFSAAGYVERGGSHVREASRITEKMGLNKTYEDYVQQYGEENAKYIWETLHSAQKNIDEDNRIVEVPETSFLGYAAKCKLQAKKDNKEYIQLDGSIKLIEKLIFGDWNDDEFLMVKPCYRILGVYDWDDVVRAEKIGGA